MPRCATGCLMWWDLAPASTSLWTGPTSTLMAKPTIMPIVADPPRPRYAAAVAHRRRTPHSRTIADALPADIKVCIARRPLGFGDQKLYRGSHRATELRLHHPLPSATSPSPPQMARCAPPPPGSDPADALAFCGGRRVTAERYQVGTVLCVQEKDEDRRGVSPPIPPRRRPGP